MSSPQKLEPGRPTLSGSTTSRSKTGGEPGKNSSASSGPRKCSNCGVEDRPEIIQGEYDAHGNQKIEHFVTVELRYFKGVQTEAEAQKRITPHLRRRGWKYKLFQGKHGMERLVCRPCLRELAIMERDWARKANGDRASSNQESYYGALCEN